MPLQPAPIYSYLREHTKGRNLYPRVVQQAREVTSAANIVYPVIKSEVWIKQSEFRIDYVLSLSQAQSY